MDTWEYSLIKKEVLTLTEIDLNFYKSPQMQRRLDTYLQRSGQSTWPNFFRSVRQDPAALRELKDYLTINVSSFFRDPQKYKELQQNILPDLLHGRARPQAWNGNGSKATSSFSAGSGLRVWSAGCSRGQEPYTLAMVLAEMTSPYTRHKILATDIDRTALDHARAGGPYTADDVANVPPKLLEQNFTVQDNRYYVKKQLQRHINFKQLNLLADPFEKDLDLIICRNVVIYFTAEVKDKLYRRFYNALRPGGILFVGGTEIVSKATEIGFETAGISFYRRRA